MSTALRKPMTLEEFLAWEECQELRYEFDGFQPVAMTGGSFAHERIGFTLRALLYNALRSKPCDVLGPTLKVEVASRIRYPDAFVFCKEPPPNTNVAREPVVIFEILSPSTSYTDRIEKLREYRATPSVQRYVILEQDRIAATIYNRSGDIWTVQTLLAGDMLEMPEIDVTLALADIYADVKLSADTKDESSQGI